MNIVICFDENFIMQACTLVTSIRYTNAGTPINVYAVTEGLSPQAQGELEKVVADTNSKIHFLDVSLENLPVLPLKGNPHLSKATYNLLGWNYWLASAANYVVGSVCSFFLNKYFTFQAKSFSAGEVLQGNVTLPDKLFLRYSYRKAAERLYELAIRIKGE